MHRDFLSFLFFVEPFSFSFYKSTMMLLRFFALHIHTLNAETLQDKVLKFDLLVF